MWRASLAGTKNCGGIPSLGVSEVDSEKVRVGVGTHQIIAKSLDFRDFLW